MRLELIRDWETPITKFHKGHHNAPEVWAAVMGITLEEFYEYLISGQFSPWFKYFELEAEKKKMLDES